MINQYYTQITLQGLIILLLFANTFVTANPIPDTGQKQSYTDTYGEDADYLINSPDYIKMDSSGVALPDNSETWTTVKDIVTDLIWEIKTNDDSQSDKDLMVNWDNAVHHVQWLNANQFAGYSDWRLPTVYELQTIVHYGQGDAYFKDFFPNTMQSFYWTQNTHVVSDSIAWAVNFDNGITWYHFKNTPQYVRGVRGKLFFSNDAFDLFDQSTVTDIRSGLMWQRNSTENAINWEQSLSYCQNLTLSGFTDWRLPTKKELISIVDYTKMNPSVYVPAFTDTQMSAYWSSTVDTNNADHQAWCIYMDIGFDGNAQDGNASVRCVRGGQNLNDNPVEIIFPEQAACWKVGQLQEIKWTPIDDGEQVIIYLSRKAGLSGTFESISEAIPNNGSYVWKVSGQASHHCMIKIVPVNDASKTSSQGLFGIDNISSGLMGYYPLNDNLMDYSGKNNHATAKGNLSTFDQLNNPNCACHLDGMKDFLDISKLTSDISENKGISFSFWIKPHSITLTHHQTLVSFSQSADNTLPRMEIYLQNGGLFFEHIQAEDNVYVCTNNMIQANEWYYISVVCDLLKTIIYVNGVETVRGPGCSLANTFSHAFIGKRAFSSENDYYWGDIDEFRIYDRCLSTSEITDLYQLKILTVKPTVFWLPSTAGSIQITVMNTGSGHMDWTAIADSSWLTIVEQQTTKSPFSLTIHYSQNLSNERNETIEIKASDYLSSSVIIDIFQNNHVINVPDEISDIQTALDQAGNGTSIRIADGTYSAENDIDFHGKSVVIQSENGPKNCIINGNFVFNHQNNLSQGLSGITIQSSDTNGIDIISSSPFIENCIIRESKSYGIYVDGSTASITNTLIISNQKAGIYGKHSGLSLIHCTIADNGEYGIEAQSSDITITNSIIWQHATSSIHSNDSIINITYSSIQNGFPGEGNINLNPLFLNTSMGDYHLSDDSPCIDVGHEFPQMPYSDLEGFLRPKPVGSKPDMGAFENPTGKEALYSVVPPKGQQGFCPEVDGSMTFMWDASSDTYQFFKVCIYKENINIKDNLILQDWSRGEPVQVAYNRLSPGISYYWSIASYPSSSDATPVTGAFYIYLPEECDNQSLKRSGFQIPGVLWGFVDRKEKPRVVQFGMTKMPLIYLRWIPGAFYGGIFYHSNYLFVPYHWNVRPTYIPLSPPFVQRVNCNDDDGFYIVNP
jgi:hypothetical protein